MQKYAFLYAGGLNERENYPCYAHDIGFAYQVLTNRLGYAKENIRCMYTDGRPIQYNGVSIQTIAASVALFQRCMQSYADQVTEDDLFLLVVTNHGNPKGAISTWDRRPPIEMDWLVAWLNKIAGRKVIIMGQCYGGNYTTDDIIIHNAVVLSANAPGCSSYRRLAVTPDGAFKLDTTNDYDEFIYHFFSYLNGATSDGNPIVDSENKSVLSAFMYAYQHDFFVNGLHVYGKYIIETPCMKPMLFSENFSL